MLCSVNFPPCSVVTSISVDQTPFETTVATPVDVEVKVAPKPTAITVGRERKKKYVAENDLNADPAVI